MLHRYILSSIAMATVLIAAAANPIVTDYSVDDCQGSLKPYPVPAAIVEYPDSLTPVAINHVGRHGARYPAGATHSKELLSLLQRADSAGTITTTGRNLMKLTQYVISESKGRWGALDSLGMAEQRGIASRMYMAYPDLLVSSPITAISSYSPRCIMSMYSFCHQLTRMNNRVEIIASSGRQYSDLMRPFDLDQDYLDFRKDNTWAPPYDAYMSETVPVSGIRRAVGQDFEMTDTEAREMALMEYYVLAGLSAMSIDTDITAYLTKEELNQLWSTFNLRQYLQRTATTVSTVPADIAAPLLNDLISTTAAAAEGRNEGHVFLRFGHAETLMPLLSLMHLPGCYYMTNYFDTVSKHWRDFDVVPLASNLQMILFRSKSGRYYLRVDLNEKPVPLIPNSTTIYLPWGEARNYLTRCLPMYMQI